MTPNKQEVAVATAMYILRQMGSDGPNGFRLTSEMLKCVAEFAVEAGAVMLSTKRVEAAMDLCAQQLAAEQFQQANMKGEVH